MDSAINPPPQMRNCQQSTDPSTINRVSRGLRRRAMGCGSSAERYATGDYGQYLAKAAAEEVAGGVPQRVDGGP